MRHLRSAAISAGVCIGLLALTLLPVHSASPTQFFQPYIVNLALLVNQLPPTPTPTTGPTATPTPVGVIQNGDFEQGHAVWLELSTNNLPIITTNLSITAPHSGRWAAWLGGSDGEDSLIEQTVTVSKNAPYLSYWHWIDSDEACGFDVAGVIIDNGQGQDPTILDGFWLCTSTATNGWQRRTVDLHSYIGKSITLGFVAGDDPASNPSSWYVDDVSTTANKSADLVGTIDPSAAAQLQLEVQRLKH